jgi:hypothetical protein
MRSGKKPLPMYRNRLILITVLDTLAWLGATAAMAAILGNSTALQIGSAVAFTVIWYVAIKVWAR